MPDLAPPPAADAAVDSRRAWLVAAAAFVVGFVVFGTLYSFGAVFEPMSAELGGSRAATSAFFSIAGLIFYMTGALTGRLSDRFGPRVVVGAGAIVMGAGLAGTACIERIEAGYLTYGIGVAVGASCAYVPSLALVGGWFDRWRATALGIAAAGTGCGVLVMPPLTAALIEGHGWRVAVAVSGAGFGSLLALCAVVVRPPTRAPGVAVRPLTRVLRSSQFVRLYASWVLATTALFVPFVFLPAFARDHGASSVAASSLLSVLGGASLVGRLGIGVLVARIGTLASFKIAVSIMAGSYVMWLASASYGLLAAFSAVLGLGYGTRIALMPGVLIELFGLQNPGAILGVFFTAGGLSAVLGPMIAGVIVDHTGSYRWAIAFALAMGAGGLAAVASLQPDRGRALDGNGRIRDA